MKNAKFIKEIVKTSGDMWNKGWAERNAGNISLRLSKEEISGNKSLEKDGEWTVLEKPLPNLGGDCFLISGTGMFLRNIQVSPKKNLGIIEMDDKGAAYRIIWGYEDGGQPTSETPAHLQAHSVRKEITNGEDKAIIHTHPANLITLTYARDLDTVSLTKLLWEMHAECIVVFPKGVEFLPWMMAGSQEIAEATAKAFLQRDIVVWEHHGVLAAGRNLDTAFGLIDTAEKSADIYIKTESIGGIKNKLLMDELIAIAHNFGLEPAQDIINAIEQLD